ncbi:unnamed protein product [Cyclocybe aegerita]|uniref:F-box domain-containing protein n=1 Tax=Cyclocybe aegerita TaxID=1973307 RepID=A0A8S0W9J8_CYCAE|nr:unnamed protein product [Cyclocybe aegerita]
MPASDMDRTISELSFDELLEALKNRLDAGDDGYTSHLSEIEDHSLSGGSQRWRDKCISRQVELSKMARVLRARANFASSINRLPGEIFAAIVHQLLPGDTFVSDAALWKGVMASLIAVTHVCSHWRTSALSDPRLWSSIYLDQRMKFSGTQALTFFQRSSPLPVSIHHKIWTSRPEPGEYAGTGSFLAALAAHPERILSLDIRGVYERRIFEFLRNPLPNLGSLRVDIRYPLSHTSDLQVQHDRRRLQSMWPLRKLSAALKRLYLHDLGAWICPLDAEERKFSQLNAGITHLYLVRWQQEDVRPVEVMNIFRSLPLLEVLWVQDMYNTPTGYDGPPVSLNACRKMRLKVSGAMGSRRYPHYLLHSLIIPSTAEIVWGAEMSMSSSQVDVTHLPPSQRLSNVKKVFVRAGQGFYYMLQNDILFLECVLPLAHEQLALLAGHLPNVRLIGMPSIEDCRLDFIVFESYAGVEHVEIYTYDALYKLVLALESGEPQGISEERGASESPRRTALCPNLSTITVHTGYFDTSIPAVAEKVLKRMERVEGFPLQLPQCGFITRQRPALGTTYAISFKKGCMQTALKSHGLRSSLENLWELEL